MYLPFEMEMHFSTRMHHQPLSTLGVYCTEGDTSPATELGPLTADYELPGMMNRNRGTLWRACSRMLLLLEKKVLTEGVLDVQVGGSFGATCGLLLMKLLPSWNIQPGVYAMCAATAMLGGVFRASISLVVLLVEGTQVCNIPCFLTHLCHHSKLQGK